MKRAAGYIAAHRKWILGVIFTAAASICGYAWPDKPWLVTLIGVLAVGLGVNYVPNREGPTEPQPQSPGPAQARAVPPP